MQLLVFIALVVANASGVVYHRTIGIPAAQRRLEMERRIMESGDGAVNTRIIGGHSADHLHFPWLAGLLIKVYNTSMLSSCGGSLISSTRVVTAAHCWKDDEGLGSSVEVVLGSDYLFYGGSRFLSYNVVLHPGAAARNTDDYIDVALIHLPNEATFSSTIKPIALPTAYKSESFAGYASFAAGYGLIHAEPKRVSSDYSRYVELEVLPNSECEISKTRPTLMCTSGRGFGFVGACYGDSGGPLSTKICGEDILIGIIQSIDVKGSPLCEAGGTSHHTRVIEVLDFLQ